MSLCAQSKSIDGKEFTSYKASYFKPHRGIFYSIYFTPVYTVDPLGFGKKSTYGFGLGTRISLWESKTPASKLSGLKITGIYTGVGFEIYPQQHSKFPLSMWIRVRTIVPLVARADMIYDRGNGLQGISYRYCFGFEIRKVCIFACGETTGPFSYVFGGSHPTAESTYTNAGSILVTIPFFERREK
jgi:hypothetical protein